MKHRFITIALCLLPLVCRASFDAQNDSVPAASQVADSTMADLAPRGTWSVGLGGNIGYFMHSGPDIKTILHAYTVSYYDLRLKWQAKPSLQANAYDRAMNYPRLQLGLMYADMNHLEIYRPSTPYYSRIGHIWTLYGGIQWDAWRHGRWSAGLDLQNGVGYCTNPYNIYDNDDQWIIGSRFTIFVNLGAYVRYQIARNWAVSAGVDFKHYSNGTLDRPNLGANSVGPSVAVEWSLSRPAPDPSPKGGNEPAGLRRPSLQGGGGGGSAPFYLDATVGMGMRALIDGFQVYHTSRHPIYAFPTVMIAPMWRWHLLHATGFGLDYSYLDYVYRIREFDETLEARGKTHTPRHGYSPHVLGLSLRHEIFYRQMSLNVGLGWNVFKRLGYTSEKEESWLYQHVGLRYSFPFTRNRLYLGFQIKAHRFGKVDCVQLVSGWRIGK